MQSLQEYVHPKIQTMSILLRSMSFQTCFSVKHERRRTLLSIQHYSKSANHHKNTIKVGKEWKLALCCLIY